MDYVNLGETGLRVSRVCLGMMSFGKHESREWALDEAAAEPIVKRAIEGGVIFFDTADVYNGGESEVVTGRLLRKLFGMREEYVVATKAARATSPSPPPAWPPRSSVSPRSRTRSTWPSPCTRRTTTCATAWYRSTAPIPCPACWKRCAVTSPRPTAASASNTCCWPASTMAPSKPRS